MIASSYDIMNIQQNNEVGWKADKISAEQRLGMKVYMIVFLEMTTDCTSWTLSIAFDSEIN